MEINVSAGYYVMQPYLENVKLRIQQGVNFIGYLDTIILGKTINDELSKIREQNL